MLSYVNRLIILKWLVILQMVQEVISTVVTFRFFVCFVSHVLSITLSLFESTCK